MLRALRRHLNALTIAPRDLIVQLGERCNSDHLSRNYLMHRDIHSQRHKLHASEADLEVPENNYHVSSVASKPKNPELKKQLQKGLVNPDEGHVRVLRRSRRAAEKQRHFVDTLLGLKDSKDSVYATLDACVAWEQDFPLVQLKKALVVVERKEQWHKVVQVVKWMLSKGQGTTMGTYEQLVNALEKDNRVEEAHEVWKKISNDLHSIRWRFCDLMLSIYHRNNMPDRLVKLFKELVAYGRKPPNKSVVQKVADAYVMLGQIDDKDKLLAKYQSLFNEFSEKSQNRAKKSRKDIRRHISESKDNNESKACTSEE